MMVGGLSSTTEYFVKNIDSNRFKLYDVGIGTTKDLSNFEKIKKYF